MSFVETEETRGNNMMMTSVRNTAMKGYLFATELIRFP